MNAFQTPPPGNTDILPPPPQPGQKFFLRGFPSSVQIVHQISDCREAVVGEIPVPYEPQARAWWRERIFSETLEYRRNYRL